MFTKAVKGMAAFYDSVAPFYSLFVHGVAAMAPKLNSWFSVSNSLNSKVFERLINLYVTGYYQSCRSTNVGQLFYQSHLWISLGLVDITKGQPSYSSGSADDITCVVGLGFISLNLDNRLATFRYRS